MVCPAQSTIRFGPGVTHEVGFDLQHLGARHVMLVTDGNLLNMKPVQHARQSLEAAGVRYT